MLVPVLVALFFVALAERGHPAISKVRGAGILAALEDPLSLFAERSPGGRGSGALLSVKPNKKTALADTGPEERVLSGVREREPPLDTLPGGDNPVFGIGPDAAAPGSGQPLDDPGAGDPSSGGPSSGGPSSGGPFGGAPFSSNTDPPLIQPYSAGSPSPTDPGIPAVPEPATWAMLIIGFFAVGVTMRRRVRGQTGPARAR